MLFMKKVCKILSIVLIFVLSLSGCGKNKDNNITNEFGNFFGDNDKIFLQQTDIRDGGYNIYYIDIKDGKTDLSMVKIK